MLYSTTGGRVNTQIAALLVRSSGGCAYSTYLSISGGLDLPRTAEVMKVPIAPDSISTFCCVTPLNWGRPKDLAACATSCFSRTRNPHSELSAIQWNYPTITNRFMQSSPWSRSNGCPQCTPLLFLIWSLIFQKGIVRLPKSLRWRERASSLIRIWQSDSIFWNPIWPPLDFPASTKTLT